MEPSGGQSSLLPACAATHTQDFTIVWLSSPQKDSYVTIAENGLGRDGAFKETAVTGVSLSSLVMKFLTFGLWRSL